MFVKESPLQNGGLANTLCEVLRGVINFSGECLKKKIAGFIKLNNKNWEMIF